MFKNTIIPIIALAALSTLSLGCFSTVGDECESSAECPQVVRSICDLSAPGGYCAIQGCESNQCPAESVCIEFDTEISFCLKSCEDNADCREGYKCKSDPNEIKYCYVD